MKNFVVTFSSICVLFPAISYLSIAPLNLSWKTNPADDMDTMQMIRKEGYEAEAHVVLTKDGYLLTIHRIPGKAGSPAIFLQHGVLGSSADWVILGKGKALAFLLADQGYDVWLGNFRGNTYSRAHVSLSTNDAKYWDFSFHECGVYDLPAMITYVVKTKGDFVKAYIGFSMGTTSFYVMASERPQIARLLQSAYSLAPVAYMKHVQSPLRYLAPIATSYKVIFNLLGKGEFMPQNFLTKRLAKYLCYVNTWEEKLCANSLFVIVGFDNTQFNYTLMSVLLNHTPAGTSSKTVVHYAQEIQSGCFRQYDYGEEGNMKVYNSTEPPKYNLTKINIPLTLFYADNDWLSNSIDVLRLTNSLPRKPRMYRVPFRKFNHIDYLWAKGAPTLVYKRVIKMLNN